MQLKISALSENEAFARSTVAAFAVMLNPSLEEINDIKTAVSEAVTNAVVHAYNSSGNGFITIDCAIVESDNFSNKFNSEIKSKKINSNNFEIESGALHITVSDSGVGIDDIDKARQPFFTTKPEQERSGMGFTVMESFMNTVEVLPNDGGGTRVVMTKIIGGKKA